MFSIFNLIWGLDLGNPFSFGLSYTNDWVNTNPIDHTKFKVQPSHTRDLKVDLGERLSTFFYGFASGETETGIKHQKYMVQATAPGTSADSVKLYAKDVSSVAEWFLKDESANEIQLTSGGKILGDNVRLSNDTYLVAKDTTGSGTIDLIKADTNNKPCLAAGVVVAGTADPASDYAVATKKYIADREGKVKADSGDGSPGYLDAKVDDASVKVNASDKLEVGNVLGSWASKNVDTVYEATTDGFVVVHTPQTTASYSAQGYTDSSNPPTTRRASYYAYYPSTTFSDAFTMPVKKGDYWKITSHGAAPTIFWMPLGK